MEPSFVPLLLQEISDAFGDLTGMSFQRKVAGVEEADDCIWNIALERIGAGWKKERVVLTPGHKKRRLMGAEVVLKFRIERDIALIIAEEIQLDFIGPRTTLDKSCRGSGRRATRLSDRTRHGCTASGWSPA